MFVNVTFIIALGVGRSSEVAIAQNTP